MTCDRGCDIEFKNQLTNKEIYMKIIKDIKLKINEEDVLRYQGYSKNKAKKPNEVILQITREEIVRGYSLFKPKGISSSNSSRCCRNSGS